MGDDPQSAPPFAHQRHKPARVLSRSRELIVACPPLRSNVNLSRIVRTVGCCGLSRVICAGPAKVISKIARDGADTVHLEAHRTLAPVLQKYRADGYRIVGLEQTTGSRDLLNYQFVRRTVLVVGHERTGLDAATLAQLDEVVEIPVWGLPHSHNVATAAAIAVYEYCRQFPDG